MAAEGRGHDEPHALVILRDLAYEPRQILAHVPAGGQHERMDDDRGRTLLDATGESSCDGGFCDFHMSRLHDDIAAEAVPDQRGHLIEERVGFRSPAPMIDQEECSASVHAKAPRIGMRGFWDPAS